MDYSLSDFIPEYPSDKDPLYQWTISTHREFNILASRQEEIAPKRGELYKHQEFMVRLMSFQDRAMVIHETGTGKSCLLVAISEYFKHNNISQYEQVYVLEKGDSTKADFINQLLNNCTIPGTYTTSKEKDYKKWYKVMTYKNFVNNEMGNKSKEELERHFSGCLFFIDEAHNIRNYSSTMTSDEGRIDTTFNDYDFDKLKNLFRLIKRSKVIVSTATPMINEPGEIGKLMELVNDYDMPDFDWSKVTLEELIPHFNGKVSFVRALDTGIDQINVGDRHLYIPNEKNKFLGPNIKLNLTEMTSKTNITHLFMVPNSYQDRDHLLSFNKNITNVAYHVPIVASSFVPPIGGIRNNDLIGGPDDLVITDRDGQSKWNDAVYDSIFDHNTGKNFKMSAFISDYNRLNECSCKFAFIVMNEINYYVKRNNSPELRDKYFNIQKIPIISEDYEKGNSFIYTDLVSKSGTTYLGITLELYGFEKFTSSHPVVDKTGQIKIHKKLRYGVIATKSTQETEYMKALFNHPDNRNGEYIQTVIGSEIARDGINLSNVTRGYLLTPMWNSAGMYQAMSRFIRSTSHLALVEQKKQETGNPNARIKVMVYKLSAVNSQKISVDDLKYAVAENKDLKIRRIMRFLKQMAVDCMVHYDRNVRPDDINETAQCDYQDCNYQCSTVSPPRHDPPIAGAMANGQGPTISEYNWINYNLLYQDDEINQVKNILSELFESGNLITFENLINLVKYYYPNSDESNIKRHVYDTIERTISQKNVISDTFGYENYIQTDGINIFAQREYPQSNIIQQDSGYYTKHIIGTLQKNVDATYRDLYLKQEDIYSQLNQLITTDDIKEHFLEIVPDQRVRIDIFEKAIINMIEDSLQPFEIALLEYYYLLVYKIREPIQNLNRVKSYLTVKASGPGAKPTGSGKRSIGKKTIDWSLKESKDTPEYFVHIYHAEDGSKYTKNILFRPASMNVRILKKIQGVYRWTNLSEIEQYVYPTLICLQFENRTKIYRERGLFGYVWDDDPDSIVFAENDPCITTSDTRRVRRGSVCATKVPRDILVYFNVLEADEIMIKHKYSDLSRKEMIKTIQEAISTKELQYYNVNLKSKSDEWLDKVYYIIEDLNKPKGLTKMTLCQILQQSFMKANIIINLPKI